MTPDLLVTQWMSDYFDTYNDSKVHAVAKGFIDADLKELGSYRAWFALEAHEVVDSFAVTLNEVSDALVSDLGFFFFFLPLLLLRFLIDLLLIISANVAVVVNAIICQLSSLRLCVLVQMFFFCH